MSASLYLYCEEKLSLLKEHLNEYSFFDIAYFLDECETIDAVKMIDESDYSKLVIDISDLIQDGIYYKIFTSRYIRALGNLNEVVFCMRSSLVSIFETRFPYLFSEFDIDSTFGEKEISAELEPKPIIIKRFDLFKYKQISNLDEQTKKTIVSLADIINEWDTVSVKYNIEEIEKTITESEIKYVDITSVIKTLKLRNDLILQFEILLHRIGRKCNVNFSVEESYLQTLIEIFPFIFESAIVLEASKKPEEKDTDDTAEIDVNFLETQIESICEKLKGHDDFKVDFRNNILKHCFLNQMDERKIFSIMLCGDSGIGKTEFAKITSEVLFPNEPLIKINFGNYSTEGVLNSLIGSPLGYIGSEEGGELINKINTSSAKLILIDEFERATPSVYNFFYELLEDGIFTDRHGNPHDLNGYIIVFTSNMSQKQYQKHIPDSLKSRFDMVYYFVDIPLDEKKKYIDATATKLIDKLNTNFDVKISKDTLDGELHQLLSLHNLRDIKRKIEDIVFVEFFEQYKTHNLSDII